MQNEKFQELVLSHLTRLTEDMCGLKQDTTTIKKDVAGLKQDTATLKQDVTELKSKLDLVYDHVVQITEVQTANLNRILKLENTTGSLAEMYGKHEVEIRNIKSILI
jgi:archaellum component FlaC